MSLNSRHNIKESIPQRVAPESGVQAALAAMEEAAFQVPGYLHSLHPHPLDKKLGSHLLYLFKETFGATCCRALKAKRPLHLKLPSKPCQDLTARFAGLVCEVWQGEMNRG